MDRGTEFEKPWCTMCVQIVESVNRGVASKGPVYCICERWREAEIDRWLNLVCLLCFQMDLMPFVNKAGCECLNESDDCGFDNCLIKDSSYLESDCDEQVYWIFSSKILVSGFTQFFSFVTDNCWSSQQKWQPSVLSAVASCLIQPMSFPLADYFGFPPRSF